MQTASPIQRFPIFTAGLLLLLSFYLPSCGIVVREYPRNKPFVFKTNIKLVGKFSREERELLTSKLTSQLDDSLRSRRVSKLLYSTLRKPPVYQAIYAENSKQYISDLLNSLGYLRDSVSYDTTLQQNNKGEGRVTVNFTVRPNSVLLLDAIRYQLSDTGLQRLTLSNLKETKLKVGAPFAKSTISEELDRLVELYRNNGYLRITREELRGVWDTLHTALLKPKADPAEQLLLIEQLQHKMEHPTANLEIQLKPGIDLTRLQNFHVGKITVYPDFTADTMGLAPTISFRDGIEFRSFRPLFHSGIFAEKIAFRPGYLYDQRHYYKTLTQLNNMGAWRLVNIEPMVRKGQDTADMTIKLTPARRFGSSVNVEGSSNQSLLSGNLFGMALNLGLQAHNLARRSIQSSTNLRLGIEIGRDTVADVSFAQARQISLTQQLLFPRVIPKASWLPIEIRDNIKSILSLNVSNTEKRELFNLSSYSAAWGYDFKYRKSLFALRFPNIEYNAIARREKLLKLIDSNALLKNIFVDGLIISASGGVQITRETPTHINSLRFHMEESGLLTGKFKSALLDSNLFRFVKVEMDLSTKRIFRKTALALRFFTGLGYELDSTAHPHKRYNMPLYRQYFAGGPNSMRAWGLRTLGPGSSIQEYGNKGLPERYGDLQIEANIEFRFPWFTLGSMRVNGALFTDIGNIWYLKKAPGRMPEEIFNVKRLGKDLAVGIGTGLRLDFSYFVIRLDYSLKAKDPSPSPANKAYQNKWFGYPTWSDMDQFQLGINYPFNL